jgi:glycosyltransferase involved in cell wall biosynthesis
MIVSNIFPPHVRGGYELGTLDVARAFAGAGHEVEVVTSAVVGVLNKTRPADGLTVRHAFAPVLAYESDFADRLEHSALWRQQRTDALGGVVPGNVVALAAAIERSAPDRIWIGNPVGVGPIGILETALGAGVPVVIHLMDDIDRYLKGYRRPAHWLARVARLKRGITAISCASHVREMNSAAGCYGAHHVILNGVDFSSIARHAAPGRHDGALRLVCFGQVEPMKGIPQLIEGVSRLASSEAPPFELDIIGPASASYADSLRLDLQSRGLADRVRLVGRLEKSDLLARLATYDAAVLLLKLDEPFGYSWLEAASAGLPVIVTRGHAVRDAFPASYPLFVEDRDDADGVAAALFWCLTHRPSLAPVGDALRRHLSATCDTATAVTPRYLDILEHAAPPRTRADAQALLASALTVDAYAMAAETERV